MHTNTFSDSIEIHNYYYFKLINFYHFCVEQFMQFPLLQSILSSFLSLSISWHTILPCSCQYMEKENKRARMRQRNRQLNELLYTETAKSGTIRLVTHLRFTNALTASAEYARGEGAHFPRTASSSFGDRQVGWSLCVFNKNYAICSKKKSCKNNSS